MAKELKSGFAFGKNKGYCAKPINRARIHTGKKRNFKLSESQILAKQVAFEICGLAPYEKKAIDILKKGNDKKCKKYLKLRLGNLKRTKKKLTFLTEKANEVVE